MDTLSISTSYIAKGRPSLISLFFATEATNDHEIDVTAESKIHARTRSDEQISIVTNNFAKRHKRKWGGRTKNSRQNRLERPLIFAMETKNDHEINSPVESTQRLVVDDIDSSNIMLHQEQQAPPQQAPLVEEQALNDQLEDIETRDDNEDPDSDNNDGDNDNNTINWLNPRTEGE